MKKGMGKNYQTVLLRKDVRWGGTVTCAAAAVFVQMSSPLPQALTVLIIWLCIAGAFAFGVPQRTIEALRGLKLTVQKLKAAHAYQFLIEAVFLVLCALLTMVSAQVISAQATFLPNPAQITDPSTAVAAVQKFLFTAAVTVLLTYVLFVVLYSLARGFIWTLFQDRTPTLRWLGYFSIANLMWTIAWGLFFGFIVLAVKREFAIPVLVIAALLAIYLTTLYHKRLALENQSIKESLAFSLGWGLFNVVKFAPMFLFAGGIVYSWTLLVQVFLPTLTSGLGTTLYAVLVFAPLSVFLRQYMLIVSENLPAARS